MAFPEQELLVVLGVAVLLFGGKKIPEVAKGMGEGIKNFKQAIKDEDEPAVKKDEPEEVKNRSRRKLHTLPARRAATASKSSKQKPRKRRIGFQKVQAE